MILSTPDPALDRSFAAALLRLQHAAYRRQVELIGSDRLESLAADEVSLPAWRGRYTVAWQGPRLLGAVAWRRSGDVIEVDRVMVDPDVHRTGIATELVSFVLAQAGRTPVETVTGRDNAPGIALYRRFGFEPVADANAPSGFPVTHLRRP